MRPTSIVTCGVFLLVLLLSFQVRAHEPGHVTGEDGTGESGTLERLAREKDLTPGFVLIALALAAGLGALHALSPGHGKAMVAAYLIGSRGRMRDAVFLGGVVTITHVSSVVILGVVALVLSARVAPERIYPWLGFASGCLIFVIGYWLLARRALGHAHDRGHAHEGEHHHHHHHSHAPPTDVTSGSLLSLGISGGMVPCPSALVVLLAAVAMHRIAFGLALILAFSVGLAAVLILIGILAVTAGRMIRPAREGRWIEVLPVVSAGVIMVIGAVLAVTSLISGGVLAVAR
jgi:ABC-type nickel/cobalt efflux system permease component RcnA